MTNHLRTRTGQLLWLAMVVAPFVPSLSIAQGGGSQRSAESTRHFEGERYITVSGTIVRSRPAPNASIVHDIPRMRMVYAKPTSDSDWLEIVGAGVGIHPYRWQGRLRPVDVENNKFVLFDQSVDRNVYRRMPGYVRKTFLASLDRPYLLPPGFLEQTAKVPGPLETYGVPERRFVPKRPLSEPYRSVVRIQIGTAGTCTGFVVGKSGLIATSGHCFSEGRDQARLSVMIPSRETHRAIPVSAKLVYWAKDDSKDSALLEVTDPRVLEVPPLALATPGAWMDAGVLQVMVLGFAGDLQLVKDHWLASDAVVHGDVCMLSAGQWYVSSVKETQRAFIVHASNSDCVTGPGDSGGPLLFWNPASSRFEVLGITTASSRVEESSNAMSNEARQLFSSIQREQTAKYGLVFDTPGSRENPMQGLSAFRKLIERTSQMIT